MQTTRRDFLKRAVVAGAGAAVAGAGLTYAAVMGWALAAEPAHQYYLLPHAADGPAAGFAGWLRGACDEAAREAQALLSGVA